MVLALDRLVLRAADLHHVCLGVLRRPDGGRGLSPAVKQPDRPRPYRCWGYPLTPALYLVICVAFLIYVVLGDPQATLSGLLLVLTGIPFYWIWRRSRSS